MLKEYDGRKVRNVRLWKLSERSLDPGVPLHEAKGVFKRELKKRDNDRKKKGGLVKKGRGKIPIKK